MTFGAAGYAPPSLRDRAHPAVTLFVLLAALLFNAALCFANTNVFAVNETLVMGAEGVILVVAFSFALGRSLGLYVLLAAFLSYAAFLMALRPMIDPKAVRDIMIPIAFYALGRRMPDPRLADRAALWSGALVVAFGLFEFLALDAYTSVFNIIRYYVARGTVAPSDVGADAGALFQSGMRPDARALLPFLGPHRASSVFLEPVSTGNFGAILILWALYRKTMRFRLTLALMGATAIVLADARFGASVSVAAAIAFLFSGRLPKAVFVAMPLLILSALAVYGLTTAEKTWSNDFGGRILWTAMLVTSLSPEAVFGLSPDKPFLSDSGYAYSLNQIGLIGFAALWALFVLLPDGSRRAWRFKAAAATYVCLLLLISDSVYTIKTAALLWFMLGVAGGAADPEPSAAGARPYRTATAAGWA
ncbi:hypothetical protein [Chenggangzhangella methanolivorans]|uniref:Polymerase n=1 Tax=Chenggangzhangella methanolivorans TaxID=1437009 RepID=A0A9E6RCV9_9HYPH|nr:hypothetical protein [Chenggangzhangella methanolivorans]QZO01500.1 hypothetical protein K6K41_08750 [Chenggangzhangella methanolivorans]